MSKKNFIALADALRPVKDQITPEVMRAIIEFCRSQNYNFKAGLFEEYLNGRCGPCGGKIKGE